MASGMARSHRGFAGTVQVLTARRRTDRLAVPWTESSRATSAETATGSVTRLWPRLVGCRVRLDVGRRAVPGRAGLEASVSPPPGAGQGDLDGQRRRRRGFGAEGRDELVDVGRQTSGPERPPRATNLNPLTVRTTCM